MKLIDTEGKNGDVSNLLRKTQVEYTPLGQISSLNAPFY